ncbi:MAG: TraB/GumN family protein [Pseudomonadota bacterium]
MVGAFAFVGLLSLAPAAQAACGGQDLIAAMGADERAALEAAAAETPNGEGRLWRVEAPDGAVGHLFGTYHDTGAVATLTAAVEDAFAASKALIVELTEAEFAAMEARLAADPAFSFTAGPDGLGARLANSLSAEEREVAEAALAERGLTLGIATGLKPWLLFSLLGTPACQIEEMAGGAPVLDRVLIERAEARGLSVSGLEDYETALAAFGRIGEAEALALARDMLSLAPLEEDLRRTLLGLYAEGRTGMIAAFSEHLAETAGAGDGDREAGAVAASEAFTEAILEDRNRSWMPRLETALAEPGAFVAVGALHLPGEEGLIALLRAAGHTVTAVPE